MSKRIFFFIALKLFLFILVLNIAFSNTKNRKKDVENNMMKSPFKGVGFGKSKSFSQSSTTTSSSSSETSNIDGKLKRKVKSSSSEAYVNKESGKPTEVRKFEEVLKKDNEKPAVYKSSASTNVDLEKLLLGNGKKKKIVSKENLRVSLYFLFFRK